MTLPSGAVCEYRGTWAIVICDGLYLNSILIRYAKRQSNNDSCSSAWSLADVDRWKLFLYENPPLEILELTPAILAIPTEIDIGMV